MTDCEVLLGLRDTLAGDAALNWSVGRPMTAWTGVTVGGTPQRVTGLNLANSGLTGELSGLLGNLTGLTELRLNGNALTGMIPSKLALLTKLTHVSISGTAFTGCAPPVLRRVATNDVAGSALADCGAPTDISIGPHTLPAGTYQFAWHEGDAPLIFDIPAGESFEISEIITQAQEFDSEGVLVIGGVGLLLREVGDSGWVGLDVYVGDEWKRHVPDPNRRTAAGRDRDHVFDLIVESMWHGTPTPAAVPTATPTPTPAVCARPTAADCIRAVYRGAPEDYAQVADIPAGALLTPDADGRYHVERGQQYTVVMAVPLPDGWTRFYLDRTPLGTPSPVLAEQLIQPVGTTYTFTVTDDEAGSTLISFELKAARPFVRPRPDGKPELGDVVVTTEFQVVACESGFAVTDPSANAELVEDCETLLGLRDTLAGDAALNWAAGTAITSWTGVTVGGTPQRVTGLNLANSGLTGELSGLLGNLTGLTELRLNGNSLTGMIPSKLALLTKLTHVSISGTAFTGCAPPVLRRVATNDVAGSALADCGAPADISYYVGNEVLTAGTYQFIWKEGDPPLIFDVPGGLSMRVDGSFAGDGEGPPIKGLILKDAATGQSWIGLDVRRGVVYGMGVIEPSSVPASAASPTPSIATLFDRLGESLWIGSAAE